MKQTNEKTNKQSNTKQNDVLPVLVFKEFFYPTTMSGSPVANAASNADPNSNRFNIRSYGASFSLRLVSKVASSAVVNLLLFKKERYAPDPRCSLKEKKAKKKKKKTEKRKKKKSSIRNEPNFEDNNI